MKSNTKPNTVNHKAIAFFRKTWKGNLSLLVSVLVLLSSFPLGPIIGSAAVVSAYEVYVEDSSGTPVEGAVVVLTDEVTSAVVTATTLADGLAAFTNVLDDSASYEISIADTAGFNDYSDTGLTCTDGGLYTAILTASVLVTDYQVEVEDNTGSGVTGAVVKLTNETTSAEVTAVTDFNGTATFTGTLDGAAAYKITIKNTPGFADYTADSVTLVQDTAYSAVLTKTYIVTTNADTVSNGTITGSQTVVSGDSLNIDVTSDPAYLIESVTDNTVEITEAAEEGTYAFTLTSILEDHEIIASFRIRTFDIEVVAPLNGEITAGGIIDPAEATETVDYGSDRNYTFIPDEGYHIESVSVDEVIVPFADLRNNNDDTFTLLLTDIVKAYKIEAVFAQDQLLPDPETTYYTMTWAGDLRNEYILTDIDGDQTRVFVFDNSAVVTLLPNEQNGYKYIALSPLKYNPFSPSVIISDSKTIFENSIYVKSRLSDPKQQVEMENIKIVIDKTVPVIKTIHKSPDSAWTNQTVTISGTAGDMGGARVQFVRYSADPEAFGTDTYAEATGSPAALADGDYSFILTSLAEGSYTYYVWTYDYAGNKSDAASITVNIDTTVPVVNTIGKSPASVWTNAQVTVSGTASDPGGAGLSAIRYSSDPDEFNTDTYSIPAGENAVLSGSDYSFVISNSDNFIGTYYVWAYDAAGNKSAVSQIDVNIDIDAPSRPTAATDISPVSGWSQGVVTISAASSDSSSGIAGMKCSGDSILSNAEDMTVSADGLTYTFAPPNREHEGSYYVWSYDTAGNYSVKSLPIAVNIDTENPVITHFDITEKNVSIPARIVNFLTFGIFFNKAVEVTVTASDAGISSGVSAISLYILASDGITTTRYDSDAVTDDKFTFTISGELEGALSASAMDHSGRSSALTSPTQVQNNIKNDTLVLEKTPPAILITPDAATYKDASDQTWYAGNVSFAIDISDNYGIEKVEISINGTPITKDKNDRIISSDFAAAQTLLESFVINTDQGIIAPDGHYTIEAKATDTAGNVSVSGITVYKDTSDPSVTGIVFSAAGGTDVNGSFVEETDYGYFFLKETTITVSANDEAPASGVKSITYYTVDYSDSAEGQKSAESTLPVNGAGQISFAVPANFKGQIYAKTSDNVSNISDAFVKPNGIVVEDAGKHALTSAVTLSIPETAYRDADGFALYQNNVGVSVVAADNYSGIEQIEWTVTALYDTGNNQSGKIVIDSSGEATGDTAGWVTTQKDINLITEMTKTIVVANNSNAVRISVKLTDHAGNTTEKNTVVSIDKTVPSVLVSYSNNSYDETFADEVQFYKADRTATIVVTERNFDAANVKASVENVMGVIPVISGWKEVINAADPDKTTHTATITYSADGDYTFDFDFTDRVGLKAADMAAQRFVIDKTIPVVLVAFDNNDAKNTNFYNNERTATITIREHNFETSRLQITGTAADNGVSKDYPVISSWSVSGDLHTATIKYSADALYTFDVSYSDKAGNAAAEFAALSFYIDLTTPTISVSGVRDKSANNGDVIPVITFADTNFDKAGVTVTLSGANRGYVNAEGSYSDSSDGVTFTFDNFDKTKEMDDLYTLTADIIDIAGNQTTKTITFSVNRFGSVYVFDNTLKEIEGKYIQNEIDLVITEINVDELTAGETNLKITKNGEIIDLSEGTDYTVAKEGGHGQWSKYTYVLSASLFSDDGKYIVTLYSKDSAGNINENIDESKEAEIWFGIDKTLPVIQATDLKSNSTYALTSKTVTTSISDNLVLSSVQIFLDGREITYTADNDKYTFAVPSSNQSQSVIILAKDSAGNEKTQEIKEFYVTTNLFVRWYTNIPVFVGSLIGLTIAVAALGYFITASKKRRRARK